MAEYCGTGSGNFPQPGDPDLNNSILNAVPAFGGIDVSWTYPGLNDHAVAHTRLYRSTSSDPATKALHRIVTGDFFYDKTTSASLIQYHYWIEIVSINGTIGDLIGPSTATAKPTIQDVLEGLSGSIDESILGQALKSKLGGIATNATAIEDEQTSRITGDDTVSLAFSDLEVDVSNVDSLIRQEITDRTEADTSIINNVNLLFTQSGDNNALILSEQTARANADSALAADLTTLETTVNDDIAVAVTGLETQIDTVDGEVTNIGALYHTVLTVNGLVGGFGIYNDGSEVVAGFDVDKFFIGRTGPDKVKPFIIDGGVVYLNEAVIKDLTFEKLRSTDGNLVVNGATGLMKAQYLEVENLRVRQAEADNGLWRFEPDGSFDMKSASTGGRLEIVGDRINVYDGSNNLRVRIGRL